MSFELLIGKNVVGITKTVFPAGESCIRLNMKDIILPDFYSKFNVHITFKFEENGELFDLLLLVDAVKRTLKEDVDLYLTMPYLPYARQDRQMMAGESLSVKIVADLINSIGFKRVYCEDIHSDVGAALINNLGHIKQADCAYKLSQYCKPENTALVSPDAGAEKKVFDVAKKLGYDTVIRASKQRDVATGKITATTLIDSVTTKDFLIVDDICDGGRTFIELAKAIRDTDYDDEGQNMYLYITHGIFSAGLDELSKHFDRIFVHNMLSKDEDVIGHPMIEII